MTSHIFRTASWPRHPWLLVWLLWSWQAAGLMGQELASNPARSPAEVSLDGEVAAETKVAGPINMSLVPSDMPMQNGIINETRFLYFYCRKYVYVC